MHPRDEIVLTMARIYRYRMTTTSGGNISILDEHGDMWITPGGVDKGSLRPEDIVCVKRNGEVIGRHKPSSEYPFHRAIYQARPDLRGIVHAHPVALVAFSISGRPPDTRVLPQARRVCGEAGFAPYAPPGSEQLGANIAEAFARGDDCVVLQNHGVVTGGAALQDAFQRFETLEFTAKTIVKASILGSVRYLTDSQLAQASHEAPRLPEFAPEPPGIRERELRKALCDFVRRGYQQRLMISTAGSFSARIDERSFLITPHPFDRYGIEPADLVLIRDGRRAAGRSPSRAVAIHEAIYRRHPEVGAVANAFPVNATAFSVCAVELSTRTIPESYVFLRDVAALPFGIEYGDSAALAEQLSPHRPAALFENGGALVTGADVLAAFDRLEVLEATAEALINSSPIGGAQPMSDAVIADLEARFPL